MSGKLNREQILHELLDTLVKGWGLKAVQDTLANLSSRAASESTKVGQPSSMAERESKAVELVLSLTLPDDRKTLLVEIAKAFDSGLAFPRTSDVKSFLSAHNNPAREIRSRDHAFRLMIPILERMSEKGLARVLSSSRHSEPAELGSISEAIKDTGNDLRGSLPSAVDQSD
jgi:hypothetical protein